MTYIKVRVVSAGRRGSIHMYELLFNYVHVFSVFFFLSFQWKQSLCLAEERTHHTNKKERKTAAHKIFILFIQYQLESVIR